jgi:acyl-CoA synthetase (AMP-forming)/AMP-acid ligase II
MISHRNVIANTMQIKYYEQHYRNLSNKGDTDIVLGLLPMSHIYALVVICHAAAYRGDQTIVLPRFEFKPLLAAIQRFQMRTLYLV